MTLDQFGLVREFAVRVGGFTPRLTAFVTGIGLNCKEGERPGAVLVQPERLSVTDDSPEEHAARHTPGPRSF
jgi:hypothetical protein